MSGQGRTFAIGDIHGDLEKVRRIVDKFGELDADDTIVFIGDYVDRGPDSKGVVDFVRALPGRVPCKVVALRGNHEDAWLRVIDGGWPEFVMPRGNGCLEALRSYQGKPPPKEDDTPEAEDLAPLLKGSFFPPDVVAWMRSLPYFYEDRHAIYVHAGLTREKPAAGSGRHGDDEDDVGKGRFLHPSEVENKTALLWTRSKDFFTNYRGKLVVFGHTKTELLPPELSRYTPDDPTDLWAGPAARGLDTGCGKGGFLTAFEMPAGRVHEAR